MIDNGSSINVCTKNFIYSHKIKQRDLTSMSTIIMGYDGIAKKVQYSYI